LGDSDVLSHADQYRLSFIFAIDLRNREFEYFQYKSGSLDENTWKSHKDLGTERTQSWWVSIGIGGFSKKIASAVDAIIQDKANHPYWKDLANWQFND
jgi:hypothetical protein